jgi:DNA-binding response OmpR family regulator
VVEWGGNKFKKHIMKKILLIEDDEEIRSIVREEAQKFGFDTVSFLPLSNIKNEINQQLSDFSKEHVYSFALLDFELWSGLKGYDLAETLTDNKIKFIAFSNSTERNAMLVKCGAISSIQKKYNSRGFDKQSLVSGLSELLKLET